MIRIEEEGEPQLVLEQLDERGEVRSGRVIVDRDLYAWRFDAKNRLEESGPLIDEEPPNDGNA